jgi:hypothetical protein
MKTDKKEEGYEINYLPENSNISPFSETSEVVPWLNEIIPEITPVKKNPHDNAEEIKKITDEERKEKERQKQIEEIIKERDRLKKKMH